MTLFYDILIVMGIIITALPAVILLYHRWHTTDSWEQNHKKLSLFIVLALFLGTTTLLYGSFIEPKLLITNYQTIDLNKIKKPIKIALFSDLHVGDFNTKKETQDIVDRIIRLNPDVVFMAGDHILSDHKNDDRLTYLDPLQKLAERIPIFAVPGNHEYGAGGNYSDLQKRFRLPNKSAEIAEKFRSLGIQYLTNDVEKITVGEESFLLFGADEYLIDKINFDNLNKSKKENPNLSIIMLAHNPTYATIVDGQDIDLILSGHTHGGQIRIPFIGHLMKIENEIPRSWYQGLNEHNGTKLFVTSGVNESGSRARLFNPPEIVLLTIK